MSNPKDYPFEDVMMNAILRVSQGWTIYQKFTCAGCGSRLTIETPNKFFTEGTCDKCSVITDIRLHGCNFLAMNVSIDDIKNPGHGAPEAG